jgi:hypothetical protein
MTTQSMYFESNGLNEKSLDSTGKPIQGEILTRRKDGTMVILRFVDGLLDGDRNTAAGKAISLPAVESAGHLEFWRGGKLHRDGGLPAVISDNFGLLEWWENGKRLP